MTDNKPDWGEVLFMAAIGAMAMLIGAMAMLIIVGNTYSCGSDNTRLRALTYRCEATCQEHGDVDHWSERTAVCACRDGSIYQVRSEATLIRDVKR